MAEFEVRYEVDPQDKWGRNVGVLTACIAILVSVVSVMADHYRERAESLERQEDSEWHFYQSREQFRNHATLAADVIRALMRQRGDNNPVLQEEKKDAEHYKVELDQIQRSARESEKASQDTAARATRLGLAVAALNLATVLSSIYFISRNRLFPALGVCWLLIGLALATYSIF